MIEIIIIILMIDPVYSIDVQNEVWNLLCCDEK